MPREAVTVALGIAGLALLLWGVLSVGKQVANNSGRGQPLGRMPVVFAALTKTLFGAFLLLTLVPYLSGAPTIASVLLLAALFSLCVTGWSKLLIKRSERLGIGTVRGLVAERWLRLRRMSAIRGGRFARSIAPTGWGEVGLYTSAGSGWRVARWIIRALLLLFILALPVSMAVFLASELSDPAGDGPALALIIGYNAVLAGAILTVTAGSTVLLLSLVGSLLVRLDFRIGVGAVVHKVATYIGLWSAGGAFVAALVPLVGSSGSRSAADFMGDEGSLGDLDPGLLLSVPAGGAIAGYLIGLVAAIVHLGKSANNLVYRRVLAPSLFVLITVVLISVGDLTPSRVFSAAYHRYEADRVILRPESDYVDLSGLSPAELTQLLVESDAEFLLEGSVIATIVAVLTAFGVAVALLKDVREAERIRRGRRAA